MKELASDIVAGVGIPDCRLEDLRPFGWKEVNSGLVDIRTAEDYTIRTESLYQEGFLSYQQTRLENPAKYEDASEMTYEAYLAACYSFPDVDFSEYSLLGFQAAGAGCSVGFEKQVFRNDKNKMILYEVTVVEEGSCETVVYNRNLILVPHIPDEYGVTYSTKISQ